MSYLPIIAAEMILASAVAIVFYWWDKRAAKKNEQAGRDHAGRTVHSRVPENTLLLISLLGGWPGAWWASQKFRHKTKKVSFRVQFWVATVLNVCLIAAFIWFQRE
ncbi:DUF1294 domain-containing protein [Rhodopirellula sp. SWK7]|uniref:DUF1294 domain-containing protein n=1 Tax=Rhodopirellula sp. SWK7 TaxID=595460 RepID=UPI001181BD83|nr:DUF1294 domain-containing protein [Rhodopirellula sp. SWK7]